MGIPYGLTSYERDPVTILSPPALKALHPLGAAPVTEDDGLLLAESATIVEYIIAKHGDGRLRLGPDHLAGREFTAADIMSVFSLTTKRLFQPLDLRAQPNILAYLQRIGARPAYRRAMAESDPDLAPMLT